MKYEDKLHQQKRYDVGMPTLYKTGWSEGYDEGYEQAKIDIGGPNVIAYVLVACLGVLWGAACACVGFFFV